MSCDFAALLSEVEFISLSQMQGESPKFKETVFWQMVYGTRDSACCFGKWYMAEVVLCLL